MYNDDRMYICKTCEHFGNILKICKLCGCFLPAKTLIKDSECPAVPPRWTKITEPTAYVPQGTCCPSRKNK